MLPYIVSVLIGYLLGCSSMALYIGKLKNVDVRKNGTGNLGASNAMMLMGWGAGVLTAFHDIGKAVLAVWLCRRLFPEVPYIGLVAGVGAVLGHNFPFYLRFKGGKGLAAFWGMTLMINWKFALAVALGITLITLITDYIFLGTIAAAIAVPIFVYFILGGAAAAIVGAASVCIIARHKDNFIRLKNGTEKGFRRANSGKERIK
jgi:glycerol-3-phosphate acyltransferase PlsY